MSTLTPQDQADRTMDLAGWRVRVRSYRLGDTFFCTVDNIDPGARIARGMGATREDAEDLAVGRALNRLEATRRRVV